MGQSTDAILFYGYCWNDEGVQLLGISDGEDEESEYEWNEILAVREGHKNPWDFYRESGAEAEYERLPYSEREAAYKAWKERVGFDDMLEQWRSVCKSIKSRYNVDISTHCSCEYPMPYIYIEESKHRAWRGEGKQLDMAQWERWQQPGVYATWEQNLNRFVADLGIDLSEAEGPGWFLVSNWC